MPGHKNKVNIKDFALTPADQLAADLVLKKKEELAPKKKRKAYRNDVDWTTEFRYPEPTQLGNVNEDNTLAFICLLYTSPSPRDRQKSRMPSSA